jgi:alanine racemase
MESIVSGARWKAPTVLRCSIWEAILLRERGWKGPILMLEGFFHADELPLLDKYRLTTSVHSNWQIKALQDARLHAPLDVYLKMNSGMNRLGFQPERVQTLWQQLRDLGNVGDMTLMSLRRGGKTDGIAEAMARIKQAAEGLDCPARWPTRRRHALASGSAF